MPLIKQGRITDDPYMMLADDAPLPATGAVIVSTTRFAAERDDLFGRGAPLGVRLAAGEMVDLIAGDVDRLAVIALEFPLFRDGRAYSKARILRDQLGYRGELRAVGNVLRDQFLFMDRCGFDAYEVADAAAAEAWQTELERFSVFYQRASDARASAAERRTRVPRAAE